MNIDLPYSKYRTLVHDGLAGIPVARRVLPHDVELGVVVDGPRITFFSRAVGGQPFAARTMKADGDILVKESGAFSIETFPLRKIGERVDVFVRSWAERQLCPPLVDGFDVAKMRVRLFTAVEQPSSGSGGREVLRFELFRPETPSRGPLISCGFSGTRLAEFKEPESAECVLSIKASVLQRYVQNYGGFLKMRGALLEINCIHGSCVLSIHNSGLSSLLELLPGEYEARQFDQRVSFSGSDFLSAAGKALEADFQICRFVDMQDRDSRIRLMVSDRQYDCECEWRDGSEMSPDSNSVAPGTRPIIVNLAEIRQAIAMMLASKLDKIRLRLHHRVALLTLVSGSRKPPNHDPGGVAPVICFLPPAQKGVSSWCVKTKHLLQLIRTMTGTKIRIYPTTGALFLADPDEPFVRHRLACLVPDDLGEEMEHVLMEIEASMVEPAEPQQAHRMNIDQRDGSL